MFTNFDAQTIESQAMKTILALLAAWLLLPFVDAMGADTQRTNIVFILADDLRPDALGCTGNTAVNTPNLDRLAARGLVFTRATCGYPICHVSRTEILTGRCLVNADVPGFKLSMDPQWTLWPEAMRRAGWHTAYCGKWHTPGTPQSSGYSETSALFSAGGAKGLPLTFPLSSTGRKVTGYTGWTFKNSNGAFTDGDAVGLTPETDARIADGAIDVIRRHKDKPFFLHVNFTAPHDPLLWPQGIEPRVDASSLELPKNFLAEHPFDHGNLVGRDERIVPAPRSQIEVQRERAVYFSLVQNIDAQFGRIVQELEQLGLLSNTLIIFSSDHGLALGSHGLMGKQNQYEHTINVPLIMAGPGITVADARSQVQCYLRDLYPTVCELTGIDIPSSVQGRSLVHVLRGDVGEIHPSLFGRFTDSQRMLRTADGWKLIWYPKIQRAQLFDVNRDAEEVLDLATEKEYQGRLHTMMDSLHDWLREQGDAVMKQP